METLSVTQKGPYAILKLDRGKANPINMKMVEELREQLQALADDPAVRGVIFAGGERIFCAGLDVIELYEYDRDTLDTFWTEFGGLVRDLVAFRKPLVGAIGGHAPAGGCVFAMPCDYRLMADGRGRIGLNEVAVSVVLPGSLYDLMAFCIGSAKAYDLILSGALLLPPDAKRIGLVHDVCPGDKLIERATAKLDEWGKLNAEVWSRTKMNLRAPLLRCLDRPFDELYGATIDYWWSDEGREAIGGFVASLKK